jgi:SAM-dependent methyltransferase
VEPGPLPHDNASVELVFSKDSIIHIADKNRLAEDIYRVLKPGGCFAASDWLHGHDGEPSPEMTAYVEAEGLDFGLAGPDTYKRALIDAGFTNVEFNSRNEWYRKVARAEREKLAGPLYKELSDKTSKEFMDHEIDVWDKMVVVLDRGELQPTHLRAWK